MKEPHFWHADINLQKLIFDRNFFGWAWSKLGTVSLVSGR